MASLPICKLEIQKRIFFPVGLNCLLVQELFPLCRRTDLQHWCMSLYIFFHWPVTKHKSARLLQDDGLCSQKPPSNVSIKRMSILSLTFLGLESPKSCILTFHKLYYLVPFIFPTPNTVCWTLGRFPHV